MSLHMRRLHEAQKTVSRRVASRPISSVFARALKEETLSWYRPEQFYPVRIGETLASKYRVVGKLGFGAHSTSLLALSGFATVRLRDRQEHPSQNYIRGLLDTFTVSGPYGEHLCLVQPPMHMTIRELQYKNPSRRLTGGLLKWTISNVLHALAFLHDEAAVVHADINPSNIMLTVDDESLFTAFEKEESEHPSPAKVIDDVRTVHASRKLGMPKDAQWGEPVLCDFGEARIGSVHRGLIQPELYRAPEVLFDMEWTAAVDIWNVAVLMWDLLENKHLFTALDETNETSATDHVAEMVAYLGLPPLEYLRRSEDTRNVFDEQGAWKHAGNTKIPSISLEQAELVLSGGEKERFLDFMRTMLRWLPEERLSAAQLLAHPWMQE